MNKILVFAVILTFCTPCSAQETSVEKLLAQSDLPMQEQFHQILKTFQVNAKDPRTNAEALLKAHTLKISIADKGEIVKQVAIFAATPTCEEGQPLFALVILHVLDLRPDIVIRILAPYLDSDNRDLRSFVRHWFKGHDKSGSSWSPLKPVNFDDYADYVCRKISRSEEVPAAFVEYIYERSPNRALLVFLAADAKRDSIARMMEMNKKDEAEQREREKNGKDAEMKRELRESLKRWESEMRERDRNVQDPELRKKLEARWRERDKNRQDTLALPPTPPPVTPKLPDKFTPLRDEMHRQRDEKRYKEIRLAEHIVSNVIWLKKKKFDERFQKALPEAKKQLAKLAEYDQWWARLYVVEIMRRHQHRELRLPDVLDKLSRDSNFTVSKLAKSTKG